MKQIINKKLYNTETAQLIHEWSHSNPSDFRYISEGLYKTKNGNYFLAGQGGPASKYAQSCGSNSMSGGSQITPLHQFEAIEWLEDHNGTEAIEKYFSGEVEEA